MSQQVLETVNHGSFLDRNQFCFHKGLLSIWKDKIYQGLDYA